MFETKLNVGSLTLKFVDTDIDVREMTVSVRRRLMATIVMVESRNLYSTYHCIVDDLPVALTTE